MLLKSSISVCPRSLNQAIDDESITILHCEKADYDAICQSLLQCMPVKAPGHYDCELGCGCMVIPRTVLDEDTYASASDSPEERVVALMAAAHYIPLIIRGTDTEFLFADNLVEGRLLTVIVYGEEKMIAELVTRRVNRMVAESN